MIPFKMMSNMSMSHHQFWNEQLGGGGGGGAEPPSSPILYKCVYWYFIDAVETIKKQKRRLHLLNPEYLVVLLAAPISYTSTQYIDFVKIFNISMDLSTIYFVNFSGFWASFVYRCHSILECCNLFYGVW